jgi:menaquinol-cytochrome c reductase iron-sulfur subunit
VPRNFSGDQMQQEKSREDNEATRDKVVSKRRSFLGVLLGIGTVGMGALLGIPVLRYVLYPLSAKSKQGGLSPVGAIEEFSNLDQPILKSITLSQIDGWRKVSSPQSVYVTRGADKKLMVLSAICPHMGCTIGWQKGQDEFVCPCHGGRFAPDGKQVSGPPPRGMDPLPHEIQDGKLMVHFEYFREDVPNEQILS